MSIAFVDCTTVNFLVSYWTTVMQDITIRGDLTEECEGPPRRVFTTYCESLIISKWKVKKIE